LDELRAAGRAPILLHGQATRAFGLDTASRLWVDHRDVDGAICFNDLVALGVVSGLARVGRQAGKDLRLVGFDDIEECQQIWPQLSSVSCDIAQFAQDTATRLLQWLDKGQRPDPILRAPVSLVARASSLGMS
jgi:LacI family transcriptional regulator